MEYRQEHLTSGRQYRKQKDKLKTHTTTDNPCLFPPSFLSLSLFFFFNLRNYLVYFFKTVHSDLIITDVEQLYAMRQDSSLKEKKRVRFSVIIKRNSELPYVERELGYNKGDVPFTFIVKLSELIMEMPCYSKGTFSIKEQR